MPVDRRKAAVFGGALALRLLLLLLFPSLPDLLTGRVEVSTPVTSFKRRKSPLNPPDHVGGFVDMIVIVQEGLFLYNRNVSPYDGGVFHQVSSGDRAPPTCSANALCAGSASASNILPFAECPSVSSSDCTFLLACRLAQCECSRHHLRFHTGGFR